MPLPSTYEACKVDLLTSDEELRAKYPADLAGRVSRIRDMYNHWLSNPSMKDRQLRDAIMSKYGISQSAAYSDIVIIHQLAPLLSQKSRDFHRARANEMYLEAYAMAKARKDVKTMAQLIASYSKTNGLDKEDEIAVPYEDIVRQPFCATLDVRVLGIKPIPDIYNHIAKLTKELLRDHADIVDVEYEEPDLEEEFLFPDIAKEQDGTDQPEGSPDLL